MNKQPRYAHQIAELVCRRYFSQIGFKDLPPKFWNDARFSRDYRLQIIKANALLKTYSGPAILNALKTKEGSRIYSLTAKWLDGIISQEQIKLNRQEKQVELGLERLKQERVQEKKQTKIESVVGITESYREHKPSGSSLFEKLD